jgi:hypothetical protein
MKETLLSCGFKFNGTCKCNGVYQEKYRKGIFEFKVAPGSQTWKLARHKHQIANGNYTNLQDKINELSI